MLGLHIGVLISQPDPAADDPAIDDRESGESLVQALRGRGLGATLIPADDPLLLAQALREAEVDACVLATHGDLGGSGQVHSQLQRCCVPVLGPAGVAVAGAYDKIRARARLASHNLPVPTSLYFGGDHDQPPRDLAYLGWPAILKPRRGSQGRGVLRLLSPQEITDVVADEITHGREIILERAIDGIEVQVVLVDGEPVGAMQIERSADLQSILAMTCPPEISDAALSGLGHLARSAARALGLARGACRVDILCSDRHNERILEVEPLPSLAPEGVVARVARAAGLRYDSLIARLLGDLPSRSERPQVTTAAALPAFA